MTGAEFTTAVNYRDGIFGAGDTFSAATQGQRRKPSVSTNEQPDLRYASDIYWGAWSAEAYTDDKNLKWILRWSISNEKALGAMVRAYGSQQIGYWPGKSFSAESEEGKALLGKFI